jgi:hypothetical protein
MVVMVYAFNMLILFIILLASAFFAEVVDFHETSPCIPATNPYDSVAFWRLYPGNWSKSAGPKDAKTF